MHQVNDIVTLTLSVVPPANAKVYSYVWSFWDGSVSVTTVPVVSKKLNMGGNPTLAGRKLSYTCQPVLEDGQSTLIHGEVQANNPPSIIPSPAISVNDRYFPFSTSLKLSAYDLEHDPVNFAYYLNGTNIGAGVSTALGPVNGTWNGTFAGVYNGTQSVLSTTVASDRTITCLVTDTQGGTTAFDFSLRGRVPPPPLTSTLVDLGGVTSDASTLPAQRIGVGQTVMFSVYARDENAASSFAFSWNFAGSNGWVTLPVYTSGTTVALPDGGFQNSVTRDISAETPGFKIVECVVQNSLTGKVANVEQAVELLANQVATTGTLTIKVNEVGADPPISISAGDKLEYGLVVTDPDADIETIYWTFSLPTGAIPSSPPINTFRQWGQKVIFDTTGWPNGNIVAQVTAFDRLGGQTSVPVPTVVIA